MPSALVLLNVELDSEADLLKALKKVEGFEKVFVVYCVAARVRADTMDELNQIVSSRVRRLENVMSTLTIIVVEESSLGMEWIRTWSTMT